MRAVKAKAMRRAVKNLSGKDVTDVQYDVGKAPHYQNVLGMWFKAAKGKPTILTHGCGRAIYKAVKRTEKMGEA